MTEATRNPDLKGTTLAYLDRVEQTHERLTATVGKVREHAARLTNQWLDDLLASQRTMLGLTRAIAAEPTNYAKNADAVMQSLTAAQERAIEFPKVLYRTNNDLASDARGLFEQSIEASKRFGKPFESFTALWQRPAQ